MKETEEKENRKKRKKVTKPEESGAIRPYEKFIKIGPDSLTDEELLAVIIRTGTRGADAMELSRRVLACPSGKEKGILRLYHLSLEQLTQINGIGLVKAVKIKCIAELSARMAQERTSSQVRFEKPDTVAAYYMERFRHLEQEELLLIMTDGKNEKIAESVLVKGSANTAAVAPREIFTQALMHRAVHIMLLHNHPSGDPVPSQADIRFTDRVKETSGLLGIPLLDHIIIGDRCYSSFREKGLL